MPNNSLPSKGVPNTRNRAKPFQVPTGETGSIMSQRILIHGTGSGLVSNDTIMSYISQCVKHNQPNMPRLAIQPINYPTESGRSNGRFPGPPAQPPASFRPWAVIGRFYKPPSRPPKRGSGSHQTQGGPWGGLLDRQPDRPLWRLHVAVFWAVGSTAQNGQRQPCSRTQLRFHPFSTSYLPQLKSNHNTCLFWCIQAREKLLQHLCSNDNINSYNINP